MKAWNLLACLLLVFAWSGCSEDTSSPPDKNPVDECALDSPVEDRGEPGVIYTWAGTGEGGYVGPTRRRLEANFAQPVDVTFRPDGNAYIVDWNNHMIREYGPDDQIRVVIGFSLNPVPGDGPLPHLPGLNDVAEPVSGLNCWLNHPTEINPLPDGNYILTAWHNHKLRLWNPTTMQEQVISGRGAGYAGDARVELDWDDVVDPDLTRYHIYRSTTSGGPYEKPVAVVADASEYVDAGVALGRTYYYVVSALSGSGTTLDESGFSDEIMVNAEPGSSSLVQRFATKAPDTPTGLTGTGGGPFPYHDPKVRFKQPSQSELGPDGHLYVLDQQNQRIRRIRDFMTDPDGIIETVVGNGVAGYNGEGLDPLETQLHFQANTNPRQSGGMVIGSDGTIYIADTLNHIVRCVDLQARTVTTLAGIPGSPGTAGDGGLGTQAQLNWPLDLEIGPDGDLYIADEDNHAVRAIDLGDGSIRTVAGTLGQTSDAGECFVPTSEAIGDGKPASEAFLYQPTGLGFDPDGRLYIVDSFHHRIRVMTLEENS